MSNEPADKKPDAEPRPETLDGEAEPVTPAADATSADDAVARERDEYLDNWKRERASFVNYKRWVEKERRNWEAAAACRLVEKLLPFIDDVDRALSASAETTDVEAVREGFRLVARSFEEALGRAGVEEIPADGAVFDPRVHEAVFQIDDADRPSGTVTETTQRGFRLGDRLIRASKVVVSRKPEPAASAPTEPPEPTSDESSPPEADAAREASEEG